MLCPAEQEILMLTSAGYRLVTIPPDVSSFQQKFPTKGCGRIAAGLRLIRLCPYSPTADLLLTTLLLCQRHKHHYQRSLK